MSTDALLARMMGDLATTRATLDRCEAVLRERDPEEKNDPEGWQMLKELRAMNEMLTALVGKVVDVFAGASE